MVEGLSVFKPETVVKSPRYSVNLNNRKLVFQQDLKNLQQEPSKIQDSSSGSETSQNARTTVSRIPKDSAEYIRNVKRKDTSPSANKKKLTLKFIDTSEIEDFINPNQEKVTLMPPLKARRSTRGPRRNTNYSLSPRCSLDLSYSSGDRSNKSSDNSPKKGENKMTFSAAAQKVTTHRPSRFSVVLDAKVVPKSKPKILPPVNLKQDLKLLLENNFGNLTKEFLLERKYRDNSDVPLMPNILKRMDDENWRWETPRYELFDDNEPSECSN